MTTIIVLSAADVQDHYLSDKKQFVSLDNTNSEPLNISCGVPQGSVLGPLLFLIYIHDFQRSSNLFDFHLFADDTNLFYANKNLTILEALVNNQLIEIQKYLCANKLSLNIDKSNFLVFHPPQKKLPFHIELLPTSQPSEDARLARRQHYRAIRE